MTAAPTTRPSGCRTRGPPSARSCSSRGSTSSPTPSCPATAPSASCSRPRPASTALTLREDLTLDVRVSASGSSSPRPDRPDGASGPGGPGDDPGHPAPDVARRPGRRGRSAGLVGGLAGAPGAPSVSTDTAPIVTWAQPLGLFLVAAIVGGTAWSTWRTVQVRRELLDAAPRGQPPGAGPRLRDRGRVRGRRLPRLRRDAGSATPRRWPTSGWAARPWPPSGGLLTVVASLLLERACRVRSDDRDN